MKRIFKWVLIIGSAAFLVCCLVFFFDNLNKLLKADDSPETSEGVEDITSINQEIKDQLLEAPWQGLRFLKNEKTWRFYALTAETREIKLGVPIQLIKIYFLDADSEIHFTWAATEIEFSGTDRTFFSDTPLEKGQLIAVQLQGDFVTQNGIFWQECDLDYCSFAQQIDSMLVLDEQGTGISNGFIRYGWLPPAYPYYGFLCWQLSTLENDIENSFSKQ